MKLMLTLGLLALSLAVQAQTKPEPPVAKPLSEHAKKDVSRHRAMAKAHEDAARCLESGEDEKACQKTLQATCKGLAIGRYCGMKHEH